MHCRKFTEGDHIDISCNHTPFTSAMPFAVPRLLRVGAQDVGVTSVEDGHGRAAEELTAGGTKLNLYCSISVNYCFPPQLAVAARLLLRALQKTIVALQSHDEAPSPGKWYVAQFREGGLRCCRRSGGRRSWRACCSLPRQISSEAWGGIEDGHTLELRLAQRRSVAGDDDELRLAGAEGLEG